MCGFLGTLNFTPSHTNWNNAASTINYRGTLWGFLDFKIGSLLSIRLPRNGNKNRPQPIKSSKGNILAFNGEIYNTTELIEKLKLKKSSDYIDAEIALLWLDKVGAKGINDFKGEFALTYICPKKNILVLARDSFGSKPLYWSKYGDKIAFGSSARGITLLINNQLFNNTQSARDFLWYGISPNSTSFENVQPVPPGKIIVVTNGKIENKDITLQNHNSENILYSLKEAIKNRTSVSKVGLSYSEGLDSSLIKEILPFKNNCYKITYKKEPQNSNSIKLLITKKDVIDNITIFSQYAERPITSISGVGMMLLNKKAREDGMEIMLSGEGADELFLGYEHYFLKSTGHPIIVSRNNQRSIIESIFNIPDYPNSKAINDLLMTANPNDWLYFDRKIRLPEHLCLMNSDLPTLLNKIEARVPFSDLVAFQEKITTLSKPKEKLWELAKTFSLNIPKKKIGLHVPCSLIGEKWLLEAAHQIDSGKYYLHFFDTSISTVDKLKKFLNLKPELSSDLFNHLNEIVARWIIGIWSFNETLKINSEKLTDLFNKQFYSKIQMKDNFLIANIITAKN